MDQTYQILTDATADLSAEIVEEVWPEGHSHAHHAGRQDLPPPL